MKKALLLVAGAALVTVVVAGCSWCGDKSACPKSDAKDCAAKASCGAASAETPATCPMK